ncbi:hypothetical protein HPB52_013875 [Rhipicephalus sanguineus]|uniref:Uncharacterized protein n=1 Tax=Rhipicephalus sanguineus TaxID=34632 RepID=A0A9D4TAB8_RHISA|nr:hypothetical protein HPB52_013875 [Rhipicephalus sanguineus]
MCNSITDGEAARREASDRQTEVEHRMNDRLADLNDNSDILGEPGEQTDVQQAQGDSTHAAAAECRAVQMRTNVMPSTATWSVSE